MPKAERITVALMLLSLAAAWVAGARRERGDLGPALREALPGAESFEERGDGIYSGSGGGSGSDSILGYVALGEARGYGGPLRAAVGVDPRGRIAKVVILDHKETVPFFRRVLKRNISGILASKSCTDPLAVGRDVDAVSGATLSSRAVVDAARDAARRIGEKALGLSVPAEEKVPVIFGGGEILLLVLILAAQAGLLRRFKYQMHLRWVTLIGGLTVVGFLYAMPLSLVNINSLLMGYWPGWRERIGWYLIFAAVFLPVLLAGTNTYCTHLCPFGATQECVGLIGGARTRSLPSRFAGFGRWMPRFLVWGLVFAALLQRNPGIPSHEVFGVMFERTGTALQAGLLAAVLLVALFVKRPWCRYLCAIRPVVELIENL